MIDQYSFHDKDVIKLDIDFYNKKIVMVLDENEENPITQLQFFDVTNLKIDFDLLSNLEELELTDATFSNENKQMVSFTFLFGFGQPSGELRFEFAKLEYT